jgi:hypothetical protein
LEILDQLLVECVPPELKGKAGKICVFSKEAYLRLKFEPLYDGVFFDSGWLEQVRAKLEKSPPEEPHFLMRPVRDSINALGSLFQAYGPVDEPRLRKKVGEFMAGATTFESIGRRNADWKTMNADWYTLIILRLANELREEIIMRGRLTDRLPAPPTSESRKR